MSANEGDVGEVRRAAQFKVLSAKSGGSSRRPDSGVINNPSQVAATINELGWENFPAEAGGKGGDGEEVTNVTMYVSGNEYRGVSGRRGHAELDALQSIVEACGGPMGFVKALPDLEIVVECTDKPVCCHCAAILGLLGIGATEGTRKTAANMGISYVIPETIRKVLALWLGLSIDHKLPNEMAGDF